MTNLRILSLDIASVHDIVAVRQRTRQLSSLLGFGAQDQVRIATAVSEITREAFAAAAGARCEFFVRNKEQASLVIEIKNRGGMVSGAADSLQHASADQPQGNGGQAPSDAMVAAQRLMDHCTITQSADRDQSVILVKHLNAFVYVTPDLLAKVSSQLAASPVTNTVSELQLQNKELLETLAELRARQEELTSLTRELEDTNRGVVALYAEIEEKADHLRKADAMKTRFLSNTSHELRTPLSSIRALAKLLLDRIDGDLTQEQERQVQFIEKAAADLSDLVNDLLDLAKIEAGKTEVHPSRFTLGELFGALRGILRPLVTNDAVDLIFAEDHAELELNTDEGKVSQILRNFISNALKFTEAGVVRVQATAAPEFDLVHIQVADTGIGIQPGDLQLIFEEFSQIEGPLQKRIKGTGLGLPLCRKLALLLGGNVQVESTFGQGSTFTLTLPLRYQQTPTDTLDATLPPVAHRS